MENIVITIVLIGLLYFCMALLISFFIFVRLDQCYPNKFRNNLISSFIVGFGWPYFLIYPLK